MDNEGFTFTALAVHVPVWENVPQDENSFVNRNVPVAVVADVNVPVNENVPTVAPKWLLVIDPFPVTVTVSSKVQEKIVTTVVSSKKVHCVPAGLTINSIERLKLVVPSQSPDAAVGSAA
jgi:hypothetical protein